MIKMIVRLVLVAFLVGGFGIIGAQEKPTPQPPKCMDVEGYHICQPYLRNLPHPECWAQKFYIKAPDENDFPFEYTCKTPAAPLPVQSTGRVCTVSYPSLAVVCSKAKE